ncbi:MAG: protein kinase, partial [Planctomycetes bacterium]|nr:protein kinase [Planctomycetota bacterium]
MTDTAAQSGDGYTETIGLPNRPQPAAAPPHIPDYRLIKIIGRGAFGTVWLAEERLVGVYRAVKVLHREGKESSHIDRELAGVQAYQTHSQDHPHLVRILKTGLGRRNGDEAARQVVYYVMEIADDARGPRPHRPEDYLPSTLASLIRQEERLPVTKTLALVDSLLQAIEHLHKAGVFHRDVKPCNILFFDGALKLADPGLAALENVDHIGTSGYLTPEGKPDDLYAFGKILYQMTTGLPADCFPEWPAYLDPADDSRLSPMR